MQGRVMHSQAYRSHDQIGADARVLVIGIGNSAMDVACDLAPQCTQHPVRMRAHAHHSAGVAEHPPRQLDMAACRSRRRAH